MTLSETCIRRPVLTTLVTASIIVLGVFAYRLLSVAALPALQASGEGLWEAFWKQPPQTKRTA